MAPLEELNPNQIRLLKPLMGKKRLNPFDPALLHDFVPPPKKKKQYGRYSDTRKKEVLQYMSFHQIKHQLPNWDEGQRHLRQRCGTAIALDLVKNPLSQGCGYYIRTPTAQETADHFLIPVGTIRAWWLNKDKWLENYQARLLHTRERHPSWPELEERLYKEFCRRRATHHVVTVAWFRRNSRQLWREIEPLAIHQFKFSAGWFSLFLRRYNISRRRITHQATRLPTECISYCNSFLKFIRRNSTPRRDAFFDPVRGCLRNRYKLSRIVNLDEVPIPFEYLDGYSYDHCGTKSVEGKSDRSGWSKRQATLILYIFADGISRIPPKIIFHGSETGPIREKESHLYHHGVTVEFNKTAYNNEDLFTKFIDIELARVLDCKEDNLLVMDVAAFHKTEGVRQRLKDHGKSSVVS
jgi:hypothetical protein